MFAASNGMGLFTAVCDPGVRGKLEEACQPGSSNPVLLSCAKKNGVDRQEEIAQRNPLKGFPLDSFPNRGARPLWLPGLPGTDSVTNRACSRTFEYSLVEGYDKLGRPDSAQSKFPLEISLRGGAAFSAMRTPVPHRSPPARIFAEQKCLAADKVSQICCSAGRSSDILQTSKTVHTRKRVLPKYVGGARLVWHCKSGTPGISKGSKPFCIYAQA